METQDTKSQVLVLIGPTAIGKTALSLELASQFDCEIISVDSMQVYKKMDIGTAKASIEERTLIPHHLIDVVDPAENYDAARFVKDASACIKEISSRKKLPLLTGGTGLYIKSLLEGIFPEAPSNQNVRDKLKKRLDAEGCDVLHEELNACDSISAEKIHKNDTQRLLRALEIYQISGTPWSQHLANQKNQECAGGLDVDALQIGLTCERKKLYQRINYRTELMIDSGLEEEVKELMSGGYGPELKSMGSIGYRHMVGYLNGDYDKPEMIRLLARDTRRYAKRQYTWFNKNEHIKWVDVENKDEVFEMVGNWRQGVQDKR